MKKPAKSSSNHNAGPELLDSTSANQKLAPPTTSNSADLQSVIAQLRYLQSETRRLKLREAQHFLSCAELDILERIAAGQSMPSRNEARSSKASEIG